MKGLESISWSKGRTKDNDARLAQMSESIKQAHANGRYKNRAYNGRKPMSDETKKKISTARTAYLKANPDKVPYLMNHSSKESYPEKYFTQVFANEGLVVEKEFRVALYSLDFAIPDRKIDIEIDGQQHYTDPVVMASDKRRTEYLAAEGWTIIRIDWGKYNRLNIVKREAYISELVSYIQGLISSLPILENVKRVDDCFGTCNICGKDTPTKRSTRCTECYGKIITERPDYSTLVSELSQMSYRKVARNYNVTDSTIRKWMRYYEKRLATSSLFVPLDGTDPSSTS